MQTRDHIRFLLGDDERQLSGLDPNLTVLEYLRGVERLNGTKEGCAEGDCGACTVLIGERDGDGIRYQAVNACIRFLGALDGKQLLTVEHLKSDDGALHPVQQAMVDTHGSQCGFCTPGFVMSMAALREENKKPTRDEINQALAGNLCRCTGYGPIVDAAEKAVISDPLASPQSVGALAAIQDDRAVHLSGEYGDWIAPRHIEHLCELLDDHQDACLVAGATDVGLWVTKQHRKLSPAIYLGDLEDLQTITETESEITIGAGVSCTQAETALANMHPDIGDLVSRIGSRQIRNAGTIGGNIANGSPIGDMPPVLIALGATLILRSRSGERSLPLDDFFIEYGRQDLQPGEFVEKVIVPKPATSRFACYKISKRFDQDITATLGAFHLTMEGALISEARICFGGMAGTPARAPKAEAALTGNPWSEESFQTAISALTEDYSPLSDMRASAEYRMKVAQNLLRKFYLENETPEVSSRLVGAGAMAHG